MWTDSTVSFLKELEDQFDYVENIFLAHDYSTHLGTQELDFDYLGDHYDKLVYDYSQNHGLELNKYLSDCTTQGTIFVFGKKNIPRSQNSRVQGNYDFMTGRVESAIQHYNMSILFAPCKPGEVIIESYAMECVNQLSIGYGVVDSGTLVVKEKKKKQANATPESIDPAAWAKAASEEIDKMLKLEHSHKRNKKNSCTHCVTAHSSKQQQSTKIAMPVVEIFQEPRIEGNNTGQRLCRYLAVAYNNRSVILCERKAYRLAFADLEEAIRHGIEHFSSPESMHETKRRLLDCFIHMRMGAYSRELFGKMSAGWPKKLLASRCEYEKLVKDLPDTDFPPESDSNFIHRRERWPRYTDAHRYRLKFYESLLAAGSNLSPLVSFKFENGQKVLVANEAIQPGELIFLDVPLATKLNRQHSMFYCHHCLLSFRASPSQKVMSNFDIYFPCHACTYVLYCSRECRDDDARLHKYECNYYVLLNTMPIVGLIFSMVVRVGFYNVCKCAVDSDMALYLEWSKHLEKVPNFAHDCWPQQQELNEEYVNFLYAYQKGEGRAQPTQSQMCRAAYFANLLLLVADGSGWLRDELNRMGNKKGKERRNKVDEERYTAMKKLLGGIFFMHLLELINGRDLTTAIGAMSPPTGNKLTDGPIKIGLALYPTAAMLSFHCYRVANTMRIFDGNMMVVRASKVIAAGEHIKLETSNFSKTATLADVTSGVSMGEGFFCDKYRDQCSCPHCTNLKTMWSAFTTKFKRSCQSHMPLTQLQDFPRKYLALACNKCHGLIQLSKNRWTCVACKTAYDDLAFTRMLVSQNKLLADFDKQLVQFCGEMEADPYVLCKRDALRKICKTVERLENVCHRDSDWMARIFGLMFELTYRGRHYHKAAAWLGRLQAFNVRTHGAYSVPVLDYYIRMVELKFMIILMGRDADNAPRRLDDLKQHCKNTFLCLSKVGSCSRTDYFDAQKRQLLELELNFAAKLAMGRAIMTTEFFTNVHSQEKCKAKGKPKLLSEKRCLTGDEFNQFMCRQLGDML